jgi:hypothetical protein
VKNNYRRVDELAIDVNTAFLIEIIYSEKEWNQMVKKLLTTHGVKL